MTSFAVNPARSRATASRMPRIALVVLLIAGGLLVVAAMIWQGISSGGAPDPTRPHTSAAVATLDIAVLVFREGLECILVLSAITAGMLGEHESYRRPIAAGAAAGAVVTLLTWFIAARAIDALAGSIPALDVQAATGLLAIVVLLVVMNWFFHRVYWTGWISMHNRRKRSLLSRANGGDTSRQRVLWGLAALGFTSLYREGFEVVLFLQSYRLQLGGHVVLGGVAIGVALAAIIGTVTFVVRRRLPYKQMLIGTGVLLGVVLLVMVGEQAQEMQLAHWLPTTVIPQLATKVPAWMGLWFSVFPTVETLAAQAAAALLVLGSYVLARRRVTR